MTKAKEECGETQITVTASTRASTISTTVLADNICSLLYIYSRYA